MTTKGTPMDPQQSTTPVPTRRRRWAIGAACAAAAALLVGGGAAATAASSPASAEPAAVVAPAAAGTPSPSATPGSSSAAKGSANHSVRVALRRALAVVIRQDGTPDYGQHAQAAARAVVNRYPAAFRHLPEKLRRDLWTLAGAAASDEAKDAQAIKAHALDGTYGAAVQKAAQAIQKAPATSGGTGKSATPKATTPPSTAPAPTPSPSSGS
ncbi:hypothetical protein [Sinomonas cellulolyticus]|uniref:Mucin-associated surface protein (MASP) n=1 Tax=Sinomonas cellulolyticus TaxID=2801916 RepID=A0ABS1K3P3_9MICC|nr:MULTISPECIES: hypothetical protein [Sinomonas]MBL0705977.1 hypothetical protein [Sinomonas cellulolyticus]